MQRPSVELADVIRAAGPAFVARSRGWFTWLHLKVVVAILRCRTGLLGGHVDACADCRHQAISYNSCRNRHCPRCQTRARDRWVQARTRDLLATGYARSRPDQDLPARGPAPHRAKKTGVTAEAVG